jgi:hypothetical protein
MTSLVKQQKQVGEYTIWKEKNTRNIKASTRNNGRAGT